MDVEVEVPLTTRIGWSAGIAAVVFAGLLAAGCAPKNPAGPSNSPPVIERVTVTPDSVAPGGTVLLNAIATDADIADTLSYSWSSLEGAFNGATDAANASWTAPGRIGWFPIVLSVGDGTATTLDTLQIRVYDSFTATITQPLNGAVFTPGDTITFKGRLAGYKDLNVSSLLIDWSSDVDGFLNASPPDTTGLLTFSTTLSYDVHRVSLTATINDTLVATDTVLVNNNQPEPVTLYDIERDYTYNRLTWTRFNDPTRFTSYQIVRTPTGGAEETIATITTDTDTVYTDSLVAIGTTYTYRILAENSFGITAASNPKSIATGVFTTYTDTRIGDMTFAGDSFYLYATLADKDKLSVLDVTANNIDYTLTVGDAPWGLGYDSLNDDLYVANSNDTTLYVVSLSAEAITDTLALPQSPLYLDINDLRSQVFVTTVGNNYPLMITQGVGGTTINEIQDSRLIIDSSLVVVDDARDLLYLTEIGGFPASLYKYNIAGANPQLLLEDTHNSLGYDLRDLAVLPNGTSLFLACQSPYHVQIVSPTDFTSQGTLATGPYPNAVEVSPDGRYAFTANSGSTVQVWDVATRTRLRTFRFAQPVTRAAIRVSPDGHYVAVGTYNTSTADATISILYLP